MSARKNPLKIAFVGTSCTGKTALFEHCRRQYGESNSFAFVEEGARAYFRANPIPARFTVDVQRAIQEVMLDNERKAHSVNPSAIFCDSSIIDQVVYTRAFGDKKGAEELYEGISLWIPTYSKFFMLDPRDVKFENDDVRKESISDRQRVFETFCELLEEKGIPYELLKGTTEERFVRVDEFVYKTNAL
jgi:nicotinamide riboside kinase